MGARIEAVSALTSRGLLRPTARRLADAATRDCLARAGKDPDDIDMLINVGVYREDGMGEPALAALIQEDVGAGLGEGPAGRSGTFSFDMINGACGVLSAIAVQAGLLRSGAIRLGAIVASDVEPGLRASQPARARPVGGALLLGWHDGDDGCTDFGTATFSEYEELLTSGLVWRDRRGRPPRPGHAGRSVMVLDQKPGYQARLAECTEEAARGFLGRLGLGTGDVDLLAAAPPSPDFLDPLTVRLGVPGDRVAYVPEDLQAAYTAGPIAALQAAARSGRLAEARNVLLLAAGAGITVTLALYRQPSA